MKIRVMRRHIKEGKQQQAKNCPIALAFKEMMGKIAEVDEQILNTENESYLMPRSAARFIRRFDQGKPVKPFSFILKE